MHHVMGLAMLIGTAAFVVFAFRQGMSVRRDDRPDRGEADSLVGGPHHDGGAGHG
jgi:hypothetical protein